MKAIFILSMMFFIPNSIIILITNNHLNMLTLAQFCFIFIGMSLYIYFSFFIKKSMKNYTKNWFKTTLFYLVGIMILFLLNIVSTVLGNQDPFSPLVMTFLSIFLSIALIYNLIKIFTGSDKNFIYKWWVYSSLFK